MLTSCAACRLQRGPAATPASRCRSNFQRGRPVRGTKGNLPTSPASTLRNAVATHEALLSLDGTTNEASRPQLSLLFSTHASNLQRGSTVCTLQMRLACSTLTSPTPQHCLLPAPLSPPQPTEQASNVAPSASLPLYAILLLLSLGLPDLLRMYYLLLSLDY